MTASKATISKSKKATPGTDEPVLTKVENKATKKPCNNDDLTKALLVILGAVAAVITLVYVYPFVTTMFGMHKEVFTSVEQLGQRHLELEQKVADLQKLVDEKSGQTTDGALQKRIDALEANNKKLEQEIVGASVDAMKHTDQKSSQMVEALKNRLDQVETKLAAGQQKLSKIPETIGLFEKLRDSMNTSKPFDKALESAKNLFDPQDKEMQQRFESLHSIAVNGTPTIDELRVEFSAVAKDIRRLLIPNDLPWYSKFVQRMRNLVVVRKAGEALQGSSSTEERLAGIQQYLENDNLEGALEAATHLPKVESHVFTEWHDQATHRLLIEQSIPIMEAHALAYLLTGEQAPQTTTETKKD